MKKSILISIVVLFLASVVFAAATDIELHPSCALCGMDRAKYAQSRMLVEYEDGTSSGLCSLHCAAVEVASSIDKTPRRIRVGDYGNRNLIDAETAFWVVGGRKPGVMTANAKWAFEERSAAEKFVKENGGVLASFDDAMKAAYQDMYQDTKRIRDRRTMKRSLQR